MNTTIGPEKCRLISGFHVVCGKLIEAVCQGSPWIIFGNEEDDAADFFDKHVISREEKFLGKPDGLASPVDKNLGGLHNKTSFAAKICIITTSAGSGSYGTVLGFASNRDKSLSMINFPEVREGDKIFEGYMGHDAFKIAGGKLVRIFPTYNKGDTNSKPTGGKRKLVYGLVPDEAMWQLRVKQAETIDTH